MLAKLNKIKNWQAALVIALIGFIVYCNGLWNQFQGDDLPQIVNNPVIHSLSNIRIFFNGSTFYNGQSTAPLTGNYYRPLMTTVFSLLYTLFGLHQFFYHLFQLLLCIGSTIILYLFFRYSFKPVMALSLALIFLLHPLDSQVVYAIPSMQDALFFFFGILALWIAFRYKSLKSLAFVSLCLFLSLLSKETGILFVIMVLLYFFWFNRKRLYPFIAFTVLPLAVYLMLKINAVGLDTRTTNSPIDHLSLVDRLLTMPSIVLFYLTKFVFPWKLASAYYWVYASYSFRHVLLPLIIDLIVIALVIYLSILIKKRAPKAQYRVFLFFTVWVTIGILAHLQIVPLDFTASEPWFYFSMAGVLGMTGLSIKTLVPRRYLHQQGRLLTILVCILIVLLGFRSAIRGSDWRNQYTLAIHDITASKEDFNAYDALTLHYYNLRQYKEAVYYGTKSTSIYSNGVDNNNLGRALMGLGNYAGAYKLFHKGLQSQDYYPIYDNLAVLTIYYGSPNADKQYLLHFAGRYPSDPIPWYCLAILEYTKLNNDVEARTAITRAYAIAPSDETVLSLYYKIMNGVPLNIDFN